MYDTDKIGLETSLAEKEDVLEKLSATPNKNLAMLHSHIKVVVGAGA